MQKYKFIVIISVVLLIFIISYIIVFRGTGTTIKEITNNKYYISDHVISQPGESVKFGYILINSKTNKQIGNWIQKYKIDVENNTIYIKSKNSIVDNYEECYVLNYKTDNVDKYLSLEEMDIKLKDIFENNSSWVVPSENS